MLSGSENHSDCVHIMILDISGSNIKCQRCFMYKVSIFFVSYIYKVDAFLVVLKYIIETTFLGGHECMQFLISVYD